MKYANQEQLEIGLRIYKGEIICYQAAEQYGTSEQTARNYMRMYRDANGLLPKRSARKSIQAPSFGSALAGLEEFKTMTKEELIQELVKA